MHRTAARSPESRPPMPVLSSSTVRHLALPPRAHEQGPQPVKHGPNRLVGTDIQRARQTERSDSVLAGGEESAGGEPQGEGRARAVENRACRHGGSPAARGALEAPVAQAQAVSLRQAYAARPGIGTGAVSTGRRPGD